MRDYTLEMETSVGMRTHIELAELPSMENMMHLVASGMFTRVCVTYRDDTIYCFSGTNMGDEAKVMMAKLGGAPQRSEG